MHNGSQLLGHVRYPCTNEMLYIQCDAISLKMEKEEKPHGKNPPPKREISIIKKDACMDGVIKTPPHYDLNHAYTIDNPSMKSPPSKRSPNDECLKTKENPMPTNKFLPLGRRYTKYRCKYASHCGQEDGRTSSICRMLWMLSLKSTHMLTSP